LLGTHALAQQQTVPADLQAAIVARALSYDRALKARAGRAVVIGVLAKSGDSVSAAAQERMLRALEAVEPHTVHGLPLQAVGSAFQDRTALLAWIDREGIDALYLTPGLANEPGHFRVTKQITDVSLVQLVLSLNHVLYEHSDLLSKATPLQRLVRP